MTKMSTLCYISRDDEVLMLHRTVKKNDINHDKWIGVGGHFEPVSYTHLRAHET